MPKTPGSLTTESSVFPFTRHLFRLRFTSPARFAHFLHGGVAHGLLGHALRTRELPAGLVPTTPESGRVAYQAGDAYHLGITLAGEARQELGRIERELRKIGGAGALPPELAMGGNFEVEAVETPAPVDVDAEASALAQDAGVLTLRFVSPLRLERPAELAGEDGSYLDRRCFPLSHFLDRLWRRLFLLDRGRWPTEDERQAAMPPVPQAAETDPASLFWIDLPQKERGRTLGGALGRVDCRGVPEPWLPLLVLGRHLQAGASTHFAFGRFALGDALGPLETPARRLVDALAERERLDRALDHVAEQSVAGGVDRVSPAHFRDERATRIPELAAAVRRGAVEASPLLGLPVRRDDRRKVRPLAIPTVADRVLQRAATELLGAAVDTLFEDCSFAYRKGFSRAGAARAIQRAYRDGFRIVLDADISAFFEEVRWDRLFAMLDALFPGEPLLELVRRWVTAPVYFDGMRLPVSSPLNPPRGTLRRRGLPQGAPISPLLANLYLDELDDEVLGDDFRLVRHADDFVVLCRDVESAQRARDAVEADLPADLQRPLGESEGGDSQVPPRSWLAQVPLDRVRAVLDERDAEHRRPRVEVVPIGRAREDRRAL